MNEAIIEMMEEIVMQAVKNSITKLREEVVDVTNARMEVKKLQLLTVAEAADVIGVSVPYVNQEVNNGNIEAMYLAGRKIRVTELERYINQKSLKNKRGEEIA